MFHIFTQVRLTGVAGPDRGNLKLRSNRNIYFSPEFHHITAI